MTAPSITERLSTVAFTVDETPHIRVDAGRCGECGGHPCLNFCPARCFTPNDQGAVDYYYVGCLECGTCLLLCEREAVAWSYPRGGCGISYRF
jgi:ferredoxin like protein